MVSCPTCGREWPATTKTCPQDGTKLSEFQSRDITRVREPHPPTGEVTKVREDVGAARRPLATDGGPTPPMLALGIEHDSAASDDALEAGAMVGEFHIERKAAEGGMAVIYAALHPLIAKRAAIKVISRELCADPDATKRFIQEARAANQIGHPNIVDVFSFGRLADGRVYQVMEWLDGETLADRLAKRGRIPVTETIEIVDQVCDALEAAHEKGIVHRDLKPDNVFLIRGAGNREVVKLLDFGIAKLVDTTGKMARRTTGDVVLGTPHYISPEQARGKDVDPASDIYALGVMTFEMLVGRLPFLADNAADMVRQHLAEAPPSPHSLVPEIPSALDRLLLAMMAKEAGNRPSMLEIRATLASLRMLAQAGFPRVTETLTGIEALPRRKTSGRSFAIGAGVLVGLCVMAAMSWRRHPAQTPVAAAQHAAAPTTPKPARGTLVIRVDAAGAHVAVDHQTVPAAGGEARLEVEAGSHRIDVEAPGKRPWHGSLAVAAGGTVDVPVWLADLAAPAAPHARKKQAAKAATSAPTGRHDDYLLDPYGSPR